MSTVLFLTGDSRGNSLKAMGDSYKSLFNAQGYEFIQIDLRDPKQFVQTLTRTLAEKPVEFAFSFMGSGSSLLGRDENGKAQNLWQGANIPYLSLIGDTPAYFFDLHVCQSPIQACLYGFPEHQALRHRLPHLDTGFIGGFQSLLLDPVDPSDIDFNKKADGSLLFLKNGNDPQQLWDSWSVLKGKPLRALRELASYLGADLTNPIGNQIDDLVTGYLSSFNLGASFFLKLRLFFVAQLDDYYRRLKSTMMTKALLDFPVKIIGESWHHVDFVGKRATYVNECDFAASQALIRDSLGLIDMSPNTGLAPHDRPCRAFGSYTLCLTNEQSFFADNFPNHDEFSFRFDVTSLRDKVADTLARPAHYIEVGIESATTFRKVAPPQAAVQQLLDVASMLRLDQRRERLPASPDFFVWPPRSLERQSSPAIA